MTAGTEPLRLGVSIECLDPQQQLESMAVLAGSVVRSVELWARTFRRDAGFTGQARRLLERAGIEVRAVHADFGAAIDISSPHSAVRASGLRSIESALDLAVRMGARTVVVHASTELGEGDVRSERLAYARDGLATAAEAAGRAGCRVALEWLQRLCLGSSPDELLGLLAGADAALAGVCVDTNHLMEDYASLPDAVRALGPRLIALHCSDYDGVFERHWLPLRGVVPWRAFLAALHEIGFAGPLHYEADLEGQTPRERLALLEDNYRQLIALAPTPAVGQSQPLS